MLKRLVDLRKQKKWSMQETADQLGIAKSTYAGYESGYREPSLHALSLMAELFDTTVDFLLNRVDEEKIKVELNCVLQSGNSFIYLDGTPLSEEELCDFIAFTRTKRQVKQTMV
ncbi:helix-turn-helix domain-containing protein [Bacillus sp. AFS031507]|uniref:helix-turn-helix domain-containing protein n=1 Tax=Bacillus sp. AFS031507 TaxID=2033496 RepID=UPI000BFE1F19|nr:helix-turn-helix transcriptional regulator [Bacillus sp. AFS031507]PGY13061.1 transcriptional regulator [Bacillus sp. AFS031507]